MGDQITKVYELKTLNGDQTYNQLERINAMFIQIAKNKQAIGSININNFDTSGFDKLTASNKELLDGMKQLTATMKEVATVGQAMVDALRVSFGRMNMATVENISGLAKMQTAMSGTGKIATDYNQKVSQLGERLFVLKQTAEATSQSLKILGEEYKDNLISESEYYTESARFTTQLQQTKTQITEVTAAMTGLNKVYNPGLLEEENGELAANRLSLQQRAQMLKLLTLAENAQAGSISEARSQAAVYRKELQGLNLTTEEGVAEQKRLIAVIDELDAFIKANSEAYTRQKINIGNYPELTIQAQELKAKMEELTASGQTETEVFKQLEVEAIRVANAMKTANSTLGGMGTITPTTSQQLSALKVNMAGLVQAGKADTAEFKQLQIEAQKLTAVLEETNVAIKGVSTVGDKFAGIVERMGLRMLANMLIFQTAIELVQTLWQEWTKLSDAEQLALDRLEDYTQYIKTLKQATADLRSDTLAAIYFDESKMNSQLAILAKQNLTLDQRFRAYQQLKNIAPQILDDLDKEAFHTAEGSERMKTQLANMQKYIEIQEKIAKGRELQQKQLLAREKGNSEEDDLLKERDLLLKKTVNPIGGKPRTAQEIEAMFTGTEQPLVHWQADFEGDPALEKLETAQISLNKIRKDRIEINNNLAYSEKNLTDLELQKAQMEGNIKEKKGKKPHDETNRDLKIEQDLTKELAAEYAKRLQVEAEKQKMISENHSKSLSDRLTAYNRYINVEQLAQTTMLDAEYQENVQALSKIAGIENKKAELRTNQEKDLLAKKQLFLSKLKTIDAQNDFLEIKNTERRQQGVYTITKQAYEQQLTEIDEFLKNKQAAIEAHYNDQNTAIYNNGKSDKKQDKALRKSNLAENVELSQSKLAGDYNKEMAISQDLWELKQKRDQNEKLIALEEELQKKMSDIEAQAGKDKKKLHEDKKAVERDNALDTKHALEELKTQSIDVFNQIGTAYLQMLQQQDAINEKHATQQLEWNKKTLDAQAQSLQQKQQNEKGYAMAQEQLEKEKLQRQRKYAEAQMAIDYASAVMKIIAANAEDFEIAGAIQIAAITAVYGAKLAMMNSVQYGSGGDVPRSGGQFGGRPHGAGGTPFVFQNRSFEAEAGELAIINKRSSASNDRMTVTGTPKQIASAINSYGGGTSFAPGAHLYRFDWGGSLGAHITPPSFIAEHYTSKATGQHPYDGVLETLNKHAGLLAMHTQALQRETYKPVILNPNHVTDYQNNNQKTVKLGSF